ncbi:TraR/DksA family transcriptional regulator [Pseudomonas sp. LS-2]|nr:TraR/DksA family transcriptional regulator [Pseudomonas sp. LS-2]
MVEGLRSNIVEKRPELLRLESHPDPADTASGEELRQRIAGEIQRDSQRINALSGALGRMNAQDSYGFCEQSGAPIGLARLLVLPEALLCVDEQERLETRGRHLRSA